MEIYSMDKSHEVRMSNLVGTVQHWIKTDDIVQQLVAYSEHSMKILEWFI